MTKTGVSFLVFGADCSYMVARCRRRDYSSRVFRRSKHRRKQRWLAGLGVLWQDTASTTRAIPTYWRKAMARRLGPRPFGLHGETIGWTRTQTVCGWWGRLILQADYANCLSLLELDNMYRYMYVCICRCNTILCLCFECTHAATSSRTLRLSSFNQRQTHLISHTHTTHSYNVIIAHIIINANINMNMYKGIVVSLNFVDTFTLLFGIIVEH